MSPHSHDHPAASVHMETFGWQTILTPGHPHARERRSKKQPEITGTTKSSHRESLTIFLSSPHLLPEMNDNNNHCTVEMERGSHSIQSITETQHRCAEIWLSVNKSVLNFRRLFERCKWGFSEGTRLITPPETGEKNHCTLSRGSRGSTESTRDVYSTQPASRPLQRPDLKLQSVSDY